MEAWHENGQSDEDREQCDWQPDQRRSNEKPDEPVRSIAKPEKPASTLPGNAPSDVKRPNWLAA